MKVTLNRNGWHRRLQHYVLGIKPGAQDDFPNLCPYFWLTVFCLLVVPFIWLVRGPVMGVLRSLAFAIEMLATVINTVADIIVRPVNEYVCKRLDQWLVEPKVKSLAPDEVFALYKRGKKRDYWLFKRWEREVGQEHWDKQFGEYRAAYWKKRDDLQAEKRRREDEELAWQLALKEERRKGEQKRRERLMRIARVTQKAAPFILAAIVIPLVAGLGWLLYTAGAWVWGWPWGSIRSQLAYAIGVCLGALAILATVVAVVAFVVVVLKKVFAKCGVLFAVPFPKTRKASRTVGRWLGAPFKALGTLLGGFGSGLVSGGILLKQYVKATKDGYCPQIEWKE
jgi:hypothetical protein